MPGEEEEASEDTIMEIANALTAPQIPSVDPGEKLKSNDVDDYLNKASDTWQEASASKSGIDDSPKLKVDKSKLVGGAARESFLSGGFNTQKISGPKSTVPGNKIGAVPLKGSSVPADKSPVIKLKDGPQKLKAGASNPIESIPPSNLKLGKASKTGSFITPPAISKGAVGASEKMKSSPFLKFIKSPYPGDKKRSDEISIVSEGESKDGRPKPESSISSSIKSISLNNPKLSKATKEYSFISPPAISKGAVGASEKMKSSPFLKFIKSPYSGDKDKSKSVSNSDKGVELNLKVSPKESDSFSKQIFQSKREISNKTVDFKSTIRMKGETASQKGGGNSFLSSLKVPKGAVIDEKKQYVGSFLKSIKSPDFFDKQKIAHSAISDSLSKISKSISAGMKSPLKGTALTGLKSTKTSNFSGGEQKTAVPPGIKSPSKETLKDESLSSAVGLPTDNGRTISIDFDQESKLREERDNWITEQNRIIQQRQITRPQKTGANKSFSEESMPTDNTASIDFKEERDNCIAEQNQMIGERQRTSSEDNKGEMSHATTDDSFAESKSAPFFASDVDTTLLPSENVATHKVPVATNNGTSNNKSEASVPESARDANKIEIDFDAETKKIEEQQKWLDEQNALVEERRIQRLMESNKNRQSVDNIQAKHLNEDEISNKETKIREAKVNKLEVDHLKPKLGGSISSTSTQLKGFAEKTNYPTDKNSASAVKKLSIDPLKSKLGSSLPLSLLKGFTAKTNELSDSKGVTKKFGLDPLKSQISSSVPNSLLKARQQKQMINLMLRVS